MNQIRILRLRGEEREEYIRASLSGMKHQQLWHIMSESGVSNSKTMKKEEMVDELTSWLLDWADRQTTDELYTRSEVRLI